jgi:hypothetical protein
MKITLLLAFLACYFHSLHAFESNSEYAFIGEQGNENWYYGSIDLDGVYEQYDHYDEQGRGWWMDAYDNFKYGNCLAANQHPGPMAESVRSFKSPKRGNITIYESLPVIHHDDNGDGVTLRILKNEDQIWPKGEDPAYLTTDIDSVTTPKISVKVNKGDMIHFAVGSNLSTRKDQTNWVIELELK